MSARLGQYACIFHAKPISPCLLAVNSRDDQKLADGQISPILLCGLPMPLSALLSRIETLNDPMQVWTTALEGFREVGLDYAIYLTARADGTVTRTLTNIPEIYENFDPAKDPFLAYCCQTYEPTKTGPEYARGYDYLPKEALTFIKVASRTGFVTGMALPVRLDQSAEYGGFNVGTGLSSEEFERTLWPRAEEIRAFCLVVHRRFDELAASSPKKLEELTARENEIIGHIALGRSRKECARLTGLSPNTVAEYTRSAYRKLGVANRVEAARVVLSKQTVPD